MGTVTETDYGFTFQRAVTGSGLMDYKARCYDPYLNRFIRPDTIVSDPGSSQGYNRYSYSNNNPINYTDPSGHKATVCSPGDACGGQYLVGPGGLAENEQKLAELAYDSTGIKQERNQQIAEKILGGTTEIALSFVAPPVGLLYQVVSDKKITGWDLAFGLIPFGLIGDLGKGLGNLDNLPINEVEEIIENTPKVKKLVNVAGEARTEGQFIDDALEFIGSEYQEVYSGVFRSPVEGGFRQVRFTDGDLLHSVYGPHGHFEYLNQFGKPLLNIHIPLLGD